MNNIDVANSRWGQSKKAVVFIQQNPVQLLPFSQDYRTAFTPWNCCAVMWLNATFALKLVVNISCSVVPHIWPSLLGIAYSAQRLLFALSTYTAVLKENLGDSWWNSTSMRLMSPTGYPQLGFSRCMSLHFRVWRYVVYWQGGSR